MTNVNSVITRLFLALFLATSMFFAFQTIDALANDKVEICHVPPKPNQTVQFATGRVIEISRDACVAHCTNHGGDQVVGDPDCERIATCVPQGLCPEGTCEVNSPESSCSVNRCIDLCETL